MNKAPRWAKRLSGHVEVAAQDGIRIGAPVRDGSTPKFQQRQGAMYHMPCPYCRGPLLEAPQCSGRALTAAEPHALYISSALPSTHIAVACLACEQAFYPLREATA